MSVRRSVLVRPWIAVIVAVVLAFAMVPAASAEPTSSEVRTELQRAQDRLDELDEQMGLAVEEYNQANDALATVQATLARTQEELAQLLDQRDTLTGQVEDHVRMMHKLGPAMELSAVMVVGDPTDVGAKSATLRRILDGQRGDLEALDAARTAVAAAERRVVDDERAAKALAAELEAARTEVQAAFSTNEAEVAQLGEVLATTLAQEEAARRAEEERLRREAEAARQRAAEQERQRLAVAQERRAQQAATTPPATTSTATTSTSTPTPAPAPAPKPEPKPAPAPSAPARASAQVAVDTAVAQLGKPYQWGGNGPNSFDCSGLTTFAWRAAGVTLPRTSRAQFSGTKRISRSELQPGDLVFYHSPISHVAMYIGGGRVVEAPNSGNNVRIRDDGLTRRGVVGFGRP